MADEVVGVEGEDHAWDVGRPAVRVPLISFRCGRRCSPADRRGEQVRPVPEIRALRPTEERRRDDHADRPAVEGHPADPDEADAVRELERQENLRVCRGSS